ncbi:MAG: aminoglycoside phosphotransferase family protein [Gammaproteobacteria bacterium]|nr:aminoglycoside phosphotransferase family protein [Gammaproteobacteria bacterium]
MTDLPAGIRDWLVHNGWNADDVSLLHGGHTASLYRFCARKIDPERQSGSWDLIYKHCVPSRSGEIPILQALSAELADFMPDILTVLDSQSERGVLMNNGGSTLKSILADSPEPASEIVLTQFAQFLATLHLSCAKKAKVWNERHALPSYPFDSSRVYANDALKRLSWLANQHIVDGFEQAQVEALHRQAESFYPSFESRVSGVSTLTHGDPHLDNVLLRNHVFHLIDWEFACLATPERDLAIFLQDVLDEKLYQTAYTAYISAMMRGGWSMLSRESKASYLSWLFDNTLMMLGWEIEKLSNGHVDAVTFRRVFAVKYRRMEEAYDALFPSLTQNSSL